MKKHISSQRGMTLIEVMVAVGITGVVSLAVMKLNKEMFKSQRTMEQKANRIDLQANFNRLMADQTVCRGSLRGLIGATVPAASGTDVPAIQRIEAPANIWYVPDPSGMGTVPKSSFGDGTTSRLIIRSIKVGGFVAQGAPFNGDNPFTVATETTHRLQRGSAQILMTLSKPEDRGATTNSTQHSFGKNLSIATTLTVIRSVNPGPHLNMITDCYSDANQHLAAMCSNLNGVIDDTDGQCKQINIFPLNAAHTAANPTDTPDFSISAESGLRARFGLYVGDQAYATASPTPTHGIGVMMPIPGNGQIAANGHIRSNTGNIVAASSLINLGLSNTGNVIAQESMAAGINVQAGQDVRAGRNVEATQAITAGTTITADGTPGQVSPFPDPSNNSIIATNGNIVAVRGNLVGARLQLTSRDATYGCNGGTVVTDAQGFTKCVIGQVTACANTVNNSKKQTEIRAFSGYDATGAPVCKVIFRFDNNKCPEGQVMVGYKANAGTGGTTSNSALMEPDCKELGENCKSTPFIVQKWTPGANVGDVGSWTDQRQFAQPSNVCKNGYNAPLDANGFKCPGTLENRELPESQPLSFGCETSARTDVNKITRYFTHWTCGEPTPIGATNTSAAMPIMASNVSERPCRLGGDKNRRTYQQCVDDGGKVYFYSKAEATTATSTVTTAYGASLSTSSQPAKSEKVKVVNKIENGKEEDSYCMLPQKDADLTTGRSWSQLMDTCDQSCDGIRAKTLTDSAVNAARDCPDKYVKSTDSAGAYYYQVARTDCEGRYLAQNGTTCSGQGLRDAYLRGSGDKIWASSNSAGSTWPGTRIGTSSGSLGSINYDGGDWDVYSDHAKSVPSAIAGYDTTVRHHDTGTNCSDNDDKVFHYAEFACYAMITGIACR